jgi:hypothetical protein
MTGHSAMGWRYRQDILLWAGDIDGAFCNSCEQAGWRALLNTANRVQPALTVAVAHCRDSQRRPRIQKLLITCEKTGAVTSNKGAAVEHKSVRAPENTAHINTPYS